MIRTLLKRLVSTVQGSVCDLTFRGVGTVDRLCIYTYTHTGRSVCLQERQVGWSKGSVEDPFVLIKFRININQLIPLLQMCSKQKQNGNSPALLHGSWVDEEAA